MNNCVSRTRDLLVAKGLINLATKVTRWIGVCSSRRSRLLLINVYHVITKKFAVGRRNTRCPGGFVLERLYPASSRCYHGGRIQLGRATSLERAACRQNLRAT